MSKWDNGFFMTAARALRVGDEVWLYYDATNFAHGAPAAFKSEGTGRGTTAKEGIGLVKWKLDRFVSADGSDEDSALTTVPIVFDGERLEINARTRPGGSVAVEILDAAGRPLPGIGRSDLFSGDELRHGVTWEGKTAVERWRGQPVALRFHLKKAQLYSYAFRARAQA